MSPGFLTRRRSPGFLSEASRQPTGLQLHLRGPFRSHLPIERDLSLRAVDLLAVWTKDLLRVCLRLRDLGLPAALKMLRWPLLGRQYPEGLKDLARQQRGKLRL